MGGSGGWQIIQTDAYEDLGVDCVVEGRSESTDTMELVRRAIRGEPLPRNLETGHPTDRDAILTPREADHLRRGRDDHGLRAPLPLLRARPQPAARRIRKRKSCGRCWPMPARGTSRSRSPRKTCSSGARCARACRSTFPTARRSLDLYSEIVNTPGVEQHLLSHATIAPAVVDPLLIEKLTEILLDKSPITLPTHSTHPRKKILSPLMGLETGSVRMARADHAGQGRAVPDRRVAQRGDPGPDHSQPQQLVPGDDAHDRQSGRDGRGRRWRRSIWSTR